MRKDLHRGEEYSGDLGVLELVRERLWRADRLSTSSFAQLPISSFVSIL